MSTKSVQETKTFHGGRLVAKRLKAHGVTHLFTLSGGHLEHGIDGHGDFRLLAWLPWPP